MLNKVFTILLSLCFLTASSLAVAQTKTSTVGRFTILDKGDTAPFDGVIYDVFGNAIILTDKEQSEKQHKLELENQKEKMQADRDRDVQNLELRIDIQERESRARIEAMTEELDKTRKIATGSGDYTIFWTSGGFVVGVLTTVLIVFAIGKASK